MTQKNINELMHTLTHLSEAFIGLNEENFVDRNIKNFFQAGTEDWKVLSENLSIITFQIDKKELEKQEVMLNEKKAKTQTARGKLKRLWMKGLSLSI